MSTVVVCEECGASVRVPENLIGSGKRLVCPKCREPLNLTDKTSGNRKKNAQSSPKPPSKTAAERTSPSAGAKPRRPAPPIGDDDAPVPMNAPAGLKPIDEDDDDAPIPMNSSPKAKAPSKPASLPPAKKPIYEEDDDEGGMYDVTAHDDTEPPPEIASAEKMFSGKNSPEARARRKMKGTVEQWKRVRTGITMSWIGSMLAVPFYVAVLTSTILEMSIEEQSAGLKSWVGIAVTSAMGLAALGGFLHLIGQIFDLFSPKDFGTRIFAIFSVSLLPLSVITLVVGAFAAGVMAATSKEGAGASLVATLGAFVIICLALFMGSGICFSFFLRGSAQCLREEGTAGNSLGLAAVMILTALLTLTFNIVEIASTPGKTTTQVFSIVELSLFIIIAIWLVAVLTSSRSAMYRFVSFDPGD